MTAYVSNIRFVVLPLAKDNYDEEEKFQERLVTYSNFTQIWAFL